MKDPSKPVTVETIKYILSSHEGPICVHSNDKLKKVPFSRSDYEYFSAILNVFWMAVTIDGGSDLNTAYWNGTAWGSRIMKEYSDKGKVTQEEERRIDFILLSKES